MSDERPTPRLRPAPPVEGSDDPARPSRTPPADPLPSSPGRGRPRRSQATVQLNTRVLPLLDDLVTLVVEEHGLSKREVIETALKKAYPAEYRRLLARERASELGT